MSRYYIIQDGARLYAETEVAAKKLARLVADKIRRPVAVHQVATRKARPKAKAITARRNPTGAQVLSKLHSVKYQVTGISPPPRRARLVAYASTDAEVKSLKRLLQAQGYSLVTAKPAAWKKNPKKRAPTRRTARRAGR